MWTLLGCNGDIPSDDSVVHVHGEYQASVATILVAMISYMLATVSAGDSAHDLVDRPEGNRLASHVQRLHYIDALHGALRRNLGRWRRSNMNFTTLAFWRGGALLMEAWNHHSVLIGHIENTNHSESCSFDVSMLFWIVRFSSSRVCYHTLLKCLLH